MAKATYYMRQIADPSSFLEKYAAMTPLGKLLMYRNIRRHQRDNTGQPYVADLKAGLLIAETSIKIDYLGYSLSGYS